MMVIADSGSTKTHWRIVDKHGNIQQENTVGFNPYYIAYKEMVNELKSSFLKDLKGNHSIYFYGSGCSTEESKTTIKRALFESTGMDSIYVFDDMTGAARATCLRSAGIVGILGTGSNSCYYDGDEIKEKVQSLGYILGDEGSGSYLGKKLMRDFIRGDMPKEISLKLEKTYKIDKESIFNNVYKKERPNKYLAGFAPFLLRNKTEKYINTLIEESFNDFFEQNINKYEKAKHVPFHCVGSVAFYFNEFLRKSAVKHNIRVGKIVESPIAGLVIYHTEDKT